MNRNDFEQVTANGLEILSKMGFRIITEDGKEVFLIDDGGDVE